MIAALDNEKLRAMARNSLAQAFAYSIMLHIIAVIGVEIGRSAGLWEQSLLPRRMERLDKNREIPLEKLVQLPQPEQEIDIPLMFIEIDPNQAVPEPPKDAKFYSTENTLAMNPNPKDSTKPKIQGPQDKVPKLFDVMKPQPEVMRPQPEPPQKETKAPQKQTPAPKQSPTPPPPVQPEPQPEKTLPQDGDIQVAKVAKPTPPPPQPKAAPPKPKPRTLADAKAQKGIITGPKMKQEGGVRRHSIDFGENVRKSIFGSYDAAFIAAVQARWFTLLDERDVVRGQAGKVVLDFRLTKDGRITEMKVVETEVGDLLAWVCQRAVLDPSPYRPFPPDLQAEMQRSMRRDYREIRFTFHYNP